MVRRARGDGTLRGMTEYRRADTSDAEAIAALHAESWRQNYRGAFTDDFLDGDLPGERLRVWRDRLGEPTEEQFVWIALDGTDLAGFVCAYGAHDPEWGSFIDNLHVAPNAKRAGIGSTLMRRAGTWLAERYPDLGVYLLVLESNTTARQFYERIGATNSKVSTMETHGGAMIRSCHYTWPRPDALSRT